MRYEAKLLLSALAALVIVAATNYIVDPYGIFAAPVDSQPLDRKLFETDVRLAKANIVSRFRPEAVILGSSRVEIGISPAHPAWQYDRVYNLGLPHASMREIQEYLEHAIAAGSLKQALVGLDFFVFNPILEPRPDFSECRLRDPGSLWTRIRSVACDAPALFLSRSALAASIAQWWPGAKDGGYLRDGSRSALSQEINLRSAGSQHAGFLKSEFRFFQNVDLLRGFLVSKASFEETAGPYFEALLRHSYRNDIDLRLFISPTHARNGMLLIEMGLQDDVTRWKRYLLAATQRIAREFGAEPYPLWDFSNFNAYTTETLPALEDADSRMRWFWESSHYTSALGGRVLDQVLGDEETGPGRILKIENLDAWSRGSEEQLADYRRAEQSDLQLMHDYLFSLEKREEVQRMFARQN